MASLAASMAQVPTPASQAQSTPPPLTPFSQPPLQPPPAHLPPPHHLPARPRRPSSSSSSSSTSSTSSSNRRSDGSGGTGTGGGAAGAGGSSGVDKNSLHGNAGGVVKPFTRQWVIALGVDTFWNAVDKVCRSPLYRPRVLLQLQRDLIKTGRLRVPYDGFADCFQRIIAQEGMSGLLRGTLGNMVAFLPVRATMPLISDGINNILKPDVRRISFPRYLFTAILSSTLAGAITLVFVYPLDLAQFRLAVDVPDSRTGDYRYSHEIDVIHKTYRESGVNGLYRGVSFSLFGSVLYRWTYFFLHESVVLPWIHQIPDEYKEYGGFVLNWTLRLAIGLLTFPLDTIQRKLMLYPPETIGYENTLATCRTIYKEEGLGGFWRGALRGAAFTIAAAVISAGVNYVRREAEERLKETTKKVTDLRKSTC